MKKMKNDNKGFTLVELIVVLVILAILAAILVPALLGYIDDARNKQLEIHGKSVYTAAQATATKFYGKGKSATNGTDQVNGKTYVETVQELAEMESAFPDGTVAVVYFNKDTTDTNASKNWTLAGIKYTENSVSIYYKPGDDAEWKDWPASDPFGSNYVAVSIAKP